MFRSLYVIDGPIHKGKTFAFTEGETAIVGPNGCGKSLLAEYMAFLLFGSVALRGKITDYKNLKVEGIVKIKNQKYKITRNTKDCQIRDGLENLICTGTKPCNLKIISMLGYDYSVYKMCNYAEQLDILGLGKMKPAERKTALDRTLGIGIVDKLVKYASDESLKYKHEAEGLHLALVEPGDAPSRPANYRPANELYNLYKQKETFLHDFEEFLKKSEPVKPVEPTFPEDLAGWDSYLMTSMLADKVRLESALLDYKSRKKPVYTMEYLNELQEQNRKRAEYLSYYKATHYLQLDKEPVMSEDEVAHKLEVKKAYTLYEEQLKAYELGKVKCPDCGREFNPYKEPPVEPTEKVTETLSELEAEKDRLIKKKALNSIPVVEYVDEPLLDMDEVIRQKDTIIAYDVAQEKITELEKDLKDYTLVTSENIARLQKYDTDAAFFEHTFALYQRDLDEYNILKNKFKDISYDDETRRLNELALSYNKCLNYEQEYAKYQERLDSYNKLLEKINELTSQEKRYRTATDNLKEMKTKIKGYVLPSLQKVASILLSEMSDGLYKTMTIDSEFNVLVEGREICLFSGSEQAMINLALRLGLGQVLTHKVFSVFIGDEIDASMRDERAQLTADCLRKVSKYINQVILISHRDIEADNYIDLGKEK